MFKKNSKQRKGWQCDCPDIETRTTPCPHMEKELSKLEAKNSISASQSGDVDRLPQEIDWDQIIIPKNISDQSVEERFQERLKRYGIDKLTRDVLTLKFVYEQSFRQIQEELYIKSVSTAFNIFQKGLKELRRKGFQNEENEDLD